MRVLICTVLFILAGAANAAGTGSMNEVQTKPEGFNGPDGVMSELLSDGGAAGGQSGSASDQKVERLKAQLSKELNADPAAEKLGSYLWKE